MPPQRRYNTDAAAARDLAKGLQNLPDTWVQCRDMLHAWTVENNFFVEPTQVVGRKIESIRRELICMRCGTVRIERYTKGKYGLDKVSQYYVYPENYQIPGVPRGVKPKSIIQQEQYRRAMIEAAGAAAHERETADR